MAAGTGSRTKNNRSTSRGSGTRKTANRGTSRNTKGRKQTADTIDGAILYDIIMIGIFAIAIILFLCNFGIIGPVGNTISSGMFGLFGILAYVAPIALFLGIAFGTINQGNFIAKRKLAAGIVLFLLAGVIAELLSGALNEESTYNLVELYKRCAANRSGGGVLAGSLAYLFHHFLAMAGTVLVIIVAGIICIVIVTEKSFVDSVVTGSQKVMEISRDDAGRRRERAEQRREMAERRRAEAAEQKRLREEEKENEKILRMDKKVSGVMLDTALKPEQEEESRDDIHEIILENMQELPIQSVDRVAENSAYDPLPDFDKINIRTAHQVFEAYEEEDYGEESAYLDEAYFEPEEEPYEEPHEEPYYEEDCRQESAYEQEPEPTLRQRPAARPAKKDPVMAAVSDKQMVSDMEAAKKRVPKKYIFPPLSRLQKGAAANGDSTKLLRETATRLQQTLNTFGVRVTITDISQGPAVTRYELQPEQGVKVSKIVGLADDIKLNLAATDIRIEAPIPGKAAVGIEVPNKENSMVALRDLLESKEFKEFPSNLSFAVGKDIAGKTVVADIAKMPHMLIAGSTGSGKSVCINTLIMSILYKAHPDDVKLIMVDPKVVELSVYNGIPHLMIPVVTEPKKAAAALQWGVAEMTDRYKKFADFNVRDLKGYNKKLETMKAAPGEEVPAKMPQIVIIVDELADLMMVAAGEVEEAICRLAQLARAAGIHLIIATQRPSVDVITGLIKANMPSRVAFAVSSGVDSRTILDMNGAEKLLGKGDMLFYPQGYPKPARVQGAFVSDKEVSDVVDFLKNQTLGNTYNEDIEEKIQNIGSSGSSGLAGGGSDRDQYFEEAGKFVIEKDKASIGMLQRVFKIGFNRAARIMDQLCEAGVVGEEEGTKPRKVLMGMEQFEQYLEEY